jgi:hypothetical protein
MACIITVFDGTLHPIGSGLKKRSKLPCIEALSRQLILWPALLWIVHWLEEPRCTAAGQLWPSITDSPVDHLIRGARMDL